MKKQLIECALTSKADFSVSLKSKSLILFKATHLIIKQGLHPITLRQFINEKIKGLPDNKGQN